MLQSACADGVARGMTSCRSRRRGITLRAPPKQAQAHSLGNEVSAMDSLDSCDRLCNVREVTSRVRSIGFLVLGSVLFACSSTSTRTGTSCPAGSPGCECTAAGLCDPGAQCIQSSHLCIAIGGSSGGSAGSSATGGSSGEAGAGNQGNGGGNGGVGGTHIGGSSGSGEGGSAGAPGGAGGVGGSTAGAGGSAASSTGGAGTGGAGTGGTGAGGDPGVVACNGNPCRVDQGKKCCVPWYDPSPMAQCIDQQSDCDSDSTADTENDITCNGPEDCALGQHCCASVVTVDNGQGPITTYDSLQCKSSCSGGEVTVCGAFPNECGANQTCAASALLENGYTVCRDN